MDNDKCIKILLAEDHNIVRHGIKSLIERHPNIKIIGETDNGIEAARLALELSPDIVIMDISLPGLNGIEATRKIKSENPQIKVLALSMYSNNCFISGMLSAGASGYLLKDCLYDELIDAINTVYKNGFLLGHSITGTVVKDYLNYLPNTNKKFSSALSPRERQVLQLIAEGNNTKEIAFSLNLSTKTVEAHRRQIMTKLNINNIADLVKYAIKEGFISI